MFLKLITYSESPWSSLSPYIIRFHFVPIHYKKNWAQWRHPHVQIPTDMIFWLWSKLVFKIFHYYRTIFLKKQLYILIKLEILYHPVYLFIFLYSFIAKKTWVQWKHPQSTSTKILYFFAGFLVFFKNYYSKEANYRKETITLIEYEILYHSMDYYIILNSFSIIQ